MSVPPVFFKVEGGPRDRPPLYAICSAAEEAIEGQKIVGAQIIGNLCRIYPMNKEERVNLLTKGLVLEGKHIHLLNTNPYRVNNPEGKEMVQLSITDLPISFANSEIEKALKADGFVLLNKIEYCKIRDEEGKLTSWISGRRRVWVEKPRKTHNNKLKMDSFTATIWFPGMARVKQCFKCNSAEHLARECTAVEKRIGEGKTVQGDEKVVLRDRPRGDIVEERHREEVVEEETVGTLEGVAEEKGLSAEGQVRKTNKSERMTAEEEEVDGPKGEKSNIHPKQKKKEESSEDDDEDEESPGDDVSKGDVSVDEEEDEESGNTEKNRTGEEKRDRSGSTTKKSTKDSKQTDIRTIIARARSVSAKRKETKSPENKKSPKQRKKKQ